MPHQDQGRSAGARAPAMAAALAWLVAPRMFGSLAFRRHCRWTPSSLVRAALVWAWSEEAALTDRFLTARQTIARTGDRQAELTVSYQAFVKLLRRHSPSLLLAVTTALRRQLREGLSHSYRVAGYLVFGVDGTRIEVPRTAANQQALGVDLQRTRRQGRRRRVDQKKADSPSIWLTTLWHVGAGLPWAWQRGTSTSSERDHLRQLLAQLPERSLLTADAGFTGYEFWKDLLAARHDFLIRVGRNVRLLRRLGVFRESAGRVYLWPETAVLRQQPPLVLRLVVAHGGRHPIYLVTSVLSGRALSDRQLIELYRARWGIEVFYRTFKQTFGRRKLRCGRPDNALLELDWSLLALWAACLYAKHKQAQRGADVTRTSPAGVLRILRRAIHDVHLPIASLVAVALVDSYHRTVKDSRDYPKKKSNFPGHSPPIIRIATKKLARKAQQLKRLTA
jgi:hypothetical protein